MASPRPASSLMSRWISALAPTSTPWVGSSRISSAGFAASQRASATFCWFPPERLPTRVSSEAVLIPSWRTNRAAIVALLAEVEEPEPRDGAEGRERGVGGRRHVEDDAVATAVFGDVGDSQGGRARRRIDRHGLAAEPDLARVGGRQAEQDARQLGPARADQSGQPEDLAGPNAQA